MPSNRFLAAWMFPKSLDVAAMVEISLDRLRSADARLHVLSNMADTLFAQVVDGAVPPRADTVLYVQRRGPYEIARREAWPGGRLFLTLTAWPRR